MTFQPPPPGLTSACHTIIMPPYHTVVYLFTENISSGESRSSAPTLWLSYVSSYSSSYMSHSGTRSKPLPFMNATWDRSDKMDEADSFLHNTNGPKLIIVNNKQTKSPKEPFTSCQYGYERGRSSPHGGTRQTRPGRTHLFVVQQESGHHWLLQRQRYGNETALVGSPSGLLEKAWKWSCERMNKTSVICTHTATLTLLRRSLLVADGWEEILPECDRWPFGCPLHTPGDTTKRTKMCCCSQFPTVTTTATTTCTCTTTVIQYYQYWALLVLFTLTNPFPRCGSIFFIWSTASSSFCALAPRISGELPETVPVTGLCAELVATACSSCTAEKMYCICVSSLKQFNGS